MAETTTHDDGNCEGCGRPLSDARSFKELREARESAEAERDAFRAIALDNAVMAAGFDLDKTEEGSPLPLVLEKFIAEAKGPDDFASTRFTEFAGKYGVTPTEAKPAATADDGAQALLEATERGEALRGASTGSAPSTQGSEDQIDKAYADGKPDLGRRLKIQDMVAKSRAS